MNKRREKNQRKKNVVELAVVNPFAAGIDISVSEFVVAIPDGIIPEACKKHGGVETSRVPYHRKYLGETEQKRAHKEAALKDVWATQGWIGQKMPDRVIMSHGGIRTENIEDPDGSGLLAGAIEESRSTPRETAGEVRGAVGDGIQGDVPTGGSAGGPAGGRRTVIPRGADTTLETLTAAILTPTQLQTLD